LKTSTPRNKIVITFIFAAVFTAAFTFGIIKTTQFPRWTVDDAFILFRYAENLVDHGELNWNPGENPVEGYTGFTLVMILSAAIKLGISPIAASHAIGIAFFFISGILMLLILRGFNISSMTVSILYFTTPFMLVHAWSGLETTLFTAAILFALYAFTLGRNKLFVFSLLLLSFTRPEGVLLSLLLLGTYRPVSRSAITAYLIPCAAYFLWRWIYYGQLLPNTFYAKASYSAPLEENVESLRLMSRNYLIMPALLGLIFFSYDHIRKQKHLIGVVLGFVGVSLVLYLHSDLVMNYAYRFFVPMYVLTLLAVGGILLGAKTNLKTLMIAFFILTIQVSFNTDRKALSKLEKHFSSYSTLLRECHIEIGNYLRTYLPPDEWLVVHSDAGAIPYYSKLRTRDFGRLNDEYLSRNFPAELEIVRRNKEMQRASKNGDREERTEEELSAIGEFVDYFFTGRPGALVFTSYSEKILSHGPETKWISSDNRFDDYRLLEIYQSSPRRNYCEFLYIRKDLVDYIYTGRPVQIEQDAKRSPDIATGKIFQLDLDTLPAGRGGKRAVPVIASSVSTRIEEASSSPDSLWTLAGRETSPLLKIECYRKLLELYGGHHHAPSACFMIGFTYLEELQDSLSARKAFDQLIDRYPGEEITESAMWILEQLDVEKSARTSPATID
jgi:arabinofuranosyltransferase